MFQFPGFPAYAYFIQRTLPGSSPGGLPHSEICGSMLIYSYPQLIAVSHVLLRLPVPRHSPYALLRLNFFGSLDDPSIICVRFVSVLKVIFLISPFAKLFLPFFHGKTIFCLVSLFSVTFLVSSLYSVFKDLLCETCVPQCQHRPIFPSSLPLSIVGTEQLNFRVRDGYGWTLFV